MGPAPFQKTNASRAERSSSGEASESATLLLVASSREEFRGLGPHFGPLDRLQWPVDYSARGDGGGKHVVMVANGPGPRLAGAAMDAARLRGQFKAVVSIGYCGALDPALKPGDIFVATEVAAHPSGRRYPVREPVTPRPYRSGPLVSVDHVVETVEEKSRLRARGYAAVEMEAAAAAERAERWQVPFYCIRAVTDGAAEDFVCSLEAARDSRGRFRRWKIVWNAVRNRTRGTRELLRLYRRTRRAAKGLGEFLAECDF